MRVTGGIYRGRKIQCPPGIIRPAMDRMRESLFAILRDLENKSFLDLFSGSGIVGIEAASRGADPIVLVEKDFKKKFIIRDNLKFVEQEVILYLKPVEQFIRNYRNQFDFIYIDPPFKFPRKTEIIELIGSHGLLKQDGTIIIHIPREESLEAGISIYNLTDERRYGGSLLKFYRHL